MSRVERNLYLHENGTYYAIFSGVPRSLRTKKVSEARRLLGQMRAQRLAEASPSATASSPIDAAQPPSALPSGLPALAGPPGLAELLAVVASLSAQVSQQSALISELHAQNGKAKPDGPLVPPFEAFQTENLDTICSTVAKDSQRMYRGTAKRLLYALRVHQRYGRMKEFSKTGRSPEPELWDVFRELGPGGAWGFWRHHKGLDNSSLNQFRCYLNAFVEGARDEDYLPDRFAKLVAKIKILPVAPGCPTIPSNQAMSALFGACRSVDAICGDVVELTAYTGQRPCNLRDIWWEHIDWQLRMMHIAQDGVRPPVDVSSDAMDLLLRLKGDRVNPTGPIIKLTDRVQKKSLKVMKQCVKALVEEYPDLRDMTNLKALRHYFASCCVMAGVDFKTVALWLGHGDGGILVAKTYGHLRRGHTQAQMTRVQFSGKQSSQPQPGDSAGPQPGQQDAA